MQVGPISSGVVLSQMLTTVNPVQNVAAGAGGIGDPEQALRVKEQQLAAAAHKVAETQGQRVESSAGQAQTVAQAQQDMAPSSPTESNDLAPVTEGNLFDYLNKAENKSGALEPSALLESATGSFVGLVEQAQEALSKQTPGIKATNATPASDPASDKPDGLPGQANMDDILDRYVSVSWAMFSASLATNSVAAASSSVNTLVKQQ